MFPLDPDALPVSGVLAVAVLARSTPRPRPGFASSGLMPRAASCLTTSISRSLRVGLLNAFSLSVRWLGASDGRSPSTSSPPVPNSASRGSGTTPRISSVEAPTAEPPLFALHPAALLNHRVAKAYAEDTRAVMVTRSRSPLPTGPSPSMPPSSSTRRWPPGPTPAGGLLRLGWTLANFAVDASSSQRGAVLPP